MYWPTAEFLFIFCLRVAGGGQEKVFAACCALSQCY